MAKDLLDLHGVKADEVFDRVDQFIVKSGSLGLHSVRIMTGKGTGVVQKEVIRYSKLGGFPWKYEKLPNGQQNTGVMVVVI